MAKTPIPRKYLGPDALYREVHHSFQNIPSRLARTSPALTDALMSAFAMFALKEPSLSAFDETVSATP